MSDDEMEFSIPYFLYVFIVGLAVIGIIVYGGIKHWPFFPTVFVGATCSFVFRWVKKIWSNILTTGEQATSADSSKPTFKLIVVVCIAMVAIASLWYGVGWCASWILQKIF
ncbi:MAG: hypothetical protein L3J05_00285 [Robiginitomaculum sp.]|nr:hypothetical protein [Robiginitomaculum sp.]